MSATTHITSSEPPSPPTHARAHVLAGESTRAYGSLRGTRARSSERIGQKMSAARATRARFQESERRKFDDIGCFPVVSKRSSCDLKGVSARVRRPVHDAGMCLCTGACVWYTPSLSWVFTTACTTALSQLLRWFTPLCSFTTHLLSHFSSCSACWRISVGLSSNQCTYLPILSKLSKS